MDLNSLIGQPVRIAVTRVPGGDYFTLTLENGYTEELEPDETRAWFKAHGVSDSLGLESALDYAWNFYEHVITIENFKVPKVAHPKFAVQI